MSALPIIFYNWDSVRPRPLDQLFGVEDLLSPFDVRICPKYCTRLCSRNINECNPSVSMDKDKFQVNLDVQQFLPEEVTVKVDDKNTITVEAKHEEKQDEHGFISRRFVRKYVLPEDHDINNVASSLSSDGVLSITAPRLKQTDSEGRTIPIQKTNVPVKPITNNEDAQNNNKND